MERLATSPPDQVRSPFPNRVGKTVLRSYLLFGHSVMNQKCMIVGCGIFYLVITNSVVDRKACIVSTLCHFLAGWRIGRALTTDVDGSI